jgi:hypothetical protein
MAGKSAKPKSKRKPKAKDAKAWRNRGRLATLDLEPQVELMMVTATPDPAIVAWCMARGASDSQALGLMRGIRARWLEVRDDAVKHEQRKVEFRRRLDFAWNLATHRPVVDEFGNVIRTEDGNVAVRADLQAIPKLLKLQMDLDGLAAPAKVLHGNLGTLSVLALTPAERRAEVDRLLERRQQFLLAGGELPANDRPVIDVEAQPVAATGG